MTDITGRGDCPKICWGLAALAAFMTFVLLLAVGEWRFFGALVVAVFMLVGLGLILNWFLCGALSLPGQSTQASGTSDRSTAAAGATGVSPATGGGGVAAVASASARTKNEVAIPAPDLKQDVQDAPVSETGRYDSASPNGDAPRDEPSTLLAGEEELAEKKGEWRYSDADPASPAAVEPVEASQAENEIAPVPVAPSAPELEIEVPEDAGPRVLPSTPLSGEADLASRKGTWTYTAPAVDTSPQIDPVPAAEPLGEDYDKDGIFEGSDEGEKPSMLDGPRDGLPDDLKQVKGIGPKLEKLCNRLGIYHFDQIAAWTDQETAWVDSNLEGFKGRVSRDQWVAQAKLLAEGGQTEFSSRVKGGGVY